ncbi:complement factor H-like isoform X2 [Paramisgurnus dabryanus]|uniref:complement factor H-like isoform X2 n=1 Tax=Paramisgurnus dabryanus TaxID=90735 RepID=UPI003CCFB4EE
MMRSSLAILSVWICLSVDATLPKVCPEPPKVDFAQVLPAFIKTIYSSGDRVHYTCKTGYVSLWEHIFECSDNKWTKTRDAACTPVKCPPIHTEWDVSASGKTEDRGYGDVIQFDCKSSDKTIDGSSSINCKETGEWSASVPKCKDISCKPPDIRHGRVKQMREHKKDETLQYECDPGYKPGQGTPKCTKQGWSLEPKCEAESQVWKCPPIHIEGDVSASGKTEGGGYGDVIQFDCKSSEKSIDGSSSIYCKGTGEWSASVPKCKDISCTPPDIQHGTVKQKKEHKKDETLQYECDPGYKPRQGNPKCTKQGWSLEPKCEAESQVLKCPPIHIEGDVSASGKTEGGGYGDVIQFDCKSPEKSIDGSSSIYCKETGEWSASVPKCKDISCTPPDIRHGTVKQKKEHKKDETLQYECDPGYKPRQGNPKCTKQGWSLEPKCEAESQVLKCPPIHIEGDVSASGKTEGGGYGDVIQFDCKSPEKSIDGSSSIYCKETGEWSASVPKCKDISCTPPDIQHGTVKQKKEHKKDETLQYDCDKGFKPRQGNPKCTKQGWSLEPKCEAESQVWKCPPIHIEGDVSASGKTEGGGYGDVIQFDCKSPEKSIDGSSSIYCKETGEWSASVPKCKDISCTPPDIQHGNVKQKKEHRKDDTLQYDCDKGYKPRQGTIKCIKQGWSLEPKCEAESQVFKCPPIHIEGDVSALGKTEGGGYGDVIQFDCKSPEKSIDGSSSIYCKETGEWSASVPKCKDISCTPPDIRHGTVKQKKDHRKDDTLQYECDPGYKPRQGTSKCTKQGWSLEPKCESESQVWKCPPIHTEGDVSASGKTEGGGYGDVIQFDCKSPEKSIDGSSSIYCKGTGEWSASVPKCKDISCTPPDIRHGTVKQKKDHRKDDTLQYECDPGYKPRQGNSKCTKQGWSLEPKCESESQVWKCPPIHTEGDVSASGKTEGGGYGDIIQFDCKSPEKSIDGSSSIYCKETGEWSASVPKCKEISCKPPNIRHGTVKQIKDHKKDETLQYECDPGYKPRQGNPKCGKQGWSLEPKCEVESQGTETETTCELSETKFGIESIVPEGKKKFRVGETVTITCSETNKTVKSFKCLENGRWDNNPVCKEKKASCTTPTVENGYIHTDRSKKRDFYYSCNPGYKPYTGNCWKPATCVNGIWINVPRCIRVDECGDLPRIKHGQLNNKQSAVEIKCESGYKPSNTVIRCVNGRWQTPTCESFCSKPHQEVNNAKLIDKIQGERKYSHGDTARYECYDDHECHGPTIAKCVTQTWIYPECTKKGQCTKPTMDVQFVTLLDEKKTFNNLDVLRYKCNKPYDKKPSGVLICKNGKWDGTFDCTSGICPAPPMIEHGDFKVEQKTGEVVTSVSYTCQPYFELNKQQRYYRCLNGKWETPPSCLKPCKITPEICKEHNIKPVLDHHMRHSDNDFKLHCNDGWNVGGSLGHSHSKAWCKDGELKIESKCTERNRSERPH